MNYLSKDDTSHSILAELVRLKIIKDELDQVEQEKQDQDYVNKYAVYSSTKKIFWNKAKEFLAANPVDERFKRPTDDQLVGIAVLFADGEVNMRRLTDMVAICQFVIDRLFENGDILIPSSKEENENFILRQEH